jgi:sugar lactone lactonase YvrE
MRPLTAQTSRGPSRIALVVAFLVAAAGLQAGLTGAAVAATPTATTLSVDPPLPAENLYVEDEFGSRVLKFPVGGGSPTTFRSGQLDRVAFDSAGDMFIAECENDQVSVIAANGEPEGTVGEELLCPDGVAVDAAGDVFILEHESHETNFSGGQIVEVPEGFGIQTVVAEELHKPLAIAVDAVGDLFIGTLKNLDEIPAGSSGLHHIASGSTQNMAVDAAGDLFAAVDNDVEEFPAGGGSKKLVTGKDCNGVAVDAAGNVFFTVQPAQEDPGGWLIELPAGGGPEIELDTHLEYPDHVAVEPAVAHAIAGLPVTLRASVQPESPREASPPTGTVTFSDGGRTLGTAQLSGTFPDTATLTTSALTEGTAQLTATYEGDASNAASLPSGPIPVVLSRRPTATTLTSSPAPPPDLLIADSGDNRVVREPAGGGAQTTVGSELSNPLGVAVDAEGDVFIADEGNHRVVKVPAGGGPQTTVGSEVSPDGVAVDASGDVFIADTGNNRVVEVPAGGGPQTTVGSGLANPDGVAVDAVGDVFIADTGNNRVVEVPTGGRPQVTVGSGLASPSGVAVDASGDVFIADTLNNRVVEVPAGGGSQTTVGSGLSSPSGVAVDASGDVFIADTGNDRVVEVPAGGGPQVTVDSELEGPFGVAVDASAATSSALGAPLSLQATVQSSPVEGSDPPTGTVTFSRSGSKLGTATLSGTIPDTATLTTSRLGAGTHHLTATYGGDVTNSPSPISVPITVVVTGNPTGTTLSVVPAPEPDLFVADLGDENVQEVPADGGPQTTVGSGLATPRGVAVDAAGDAFIADTGNDRVLEVPAGGGPQTTVGTGLSEPRAVAVDAAGDVFIADTGNDRVVEVPAGGGQQSTIRAGLSEPKGVAVDAAGDVFIADTLHNEVVEVPAGGGPQITVGSELENPTGLAVDAAGDVFIVDSANARVVEVPAGGGPQTNVGTGLFFPEGVAVDAAGDVFIADRGNEDVVEVPAGGGPQTTVDAELSEPVAVAVDQPVAETGGAPVTLRATVQSSPVGSGPATGTVIFSEGGRTIGTGTLSGTFPDIATMTTTTLQDGTHHLTASYGGKATHGASQAAPITVVVSGTAVLRVSPGTLEFGVQRPGTTSGAQTMTVSNAGGYPMTVGQIAIEGTNADQFVLAEDECSGHSVPPGGECEVELTFSPTAVGGQEASVQIPTTALDTQIPLTGIGRDPTGLLSISPGNLAFGTVQTLTESPSQTVTVSNLGDAPLTLGQLTLAGSNADQFAVPGDGCSGKELAPAASCAVQVTFSPTTDGASEATLEIPSNLTAGKVTVTGTGETPSSPPPPSGPTSPPSGSTSPPPGSMSPPGAAPQSPGPAGPSRPDLAVAVTGPRQGVSGGRLTYEITVTNKGTATATKTALSSRLKGAGAKIDTRDGKGCRLGRATCELGSLTPGKSAKVKVTVIAGRPGRLTLTAAVRAPGATSDQARATTTIAPDEAHR